MKITKLFLAFLCLIFSTSQVLTQTDRQTVRGIVIDAESKVPLIGANVILIMGQETLGSSTDASGEFRIDGVPLGRHDIQASYLSYESKTLTGVLFTSGKEVIIEIQLQESTVTLEGLTISAASSINKNKSLNPFSNVSSRTFSIEETSRYAASVFDPARMAQNYAGVSVATGSEDIFNEIIVRGNSPAGVLWRLEGIEIPNPNHFGDLGNSGGAISMLSSTTLTHSDFYTGAFPAEFGNATSGVFDLRMSNGNNEKREYAFMLGALGVEFGMEGPISKKQGSSYLFNYRYSTLALLQATGINPAGEVLPTYQDLSFKLNFPNKKLGNLSIFGLAGNNLAANNPPLDSLEWTEPGDDEGFEEKGTMAVVGVTHRKLFDNDAYLRTSLAGSYERNIGFDYKIEDDYSQLADSRDNTRQSVLRLSTMYHKKLSSKNSYRFGAIASFKDFKFDFDDKNPEEPTQLKRVFHNSSKNSFLQGYGQWKYRINDGVSLYGGIHASVLTSNSNYSVEPRLSLRWKLNDKNEFSIATGLHSKMEHMALYSFEGKFANGFEVIKNSDLELSKSYHNVLGYDFSPSRDFRIKLEFYYQYLFDIPIQADPESKYSILNSFDIYTALDIDKFVSEGKGRNIGVDVTIEKSLSEGYYLMLTGSIYDSKYQTNTGVWYNTRFDGGYQAHLLFGKEYKLGKNTLGFNVKGIIAGGVRYSEIDLANSIIQGREVIFNNPPYNIQVDPYMRIDWGIKYQMNFENSTHSLMFDIQNTTNRENPFLSEYDKASQTLIQDDLVGLFPFINYRIEF